MHRLHILFTLALLVGALLTAPAAAHDLWIEPSDYEPRADAAITVRLRVGEAFAGVAAVLPSRTKRFVAVDGNGERAILPTPTGDPAGILGGARAGDVTLGLETRPTLHVLPAGRFEQYLAEEGLESISRQRRENGQAARPGRELFSRSITSLIRVSGGDGATDAQPLPVGLPLELIPTRSPYDLEPGDRLPVRLLFEGQPLAGALIVATARARPDAPQRVRTDASGYAELNLEQSGDWLVKTVHMAATGSDPDADWRSWWSALTFSLSRR